ncbi:YdcF family protein [uncultured Enterovirga sp.]|uniref:YdcF family protein n=1 Tax=uncultured Enterovirga sp. TaxID=2026352 RepID=UPI0035CAD90F
MTPMSGDTRGRPERPSASQVVMQRDVPWWRGRFVMIVLAPFALVGVAFLAGFASFLFSLEHAERAPATSTDGIVVLTGGAQRIEDAIELLAKGYAGRLLITGVNERTSRETIKRLTPGQREFVECCVDLDYRAQNTVGNAAEIALWVRSRGFTSLIVVTSNYHLPRTLAELDEALPEIRKIPYAVVASGRGPDGFWSLAARAKLLVSEYIKYIAVSVRLRVAGWLGPHGRNSRSTGITEPADVCGPGCRLAATAPSPYPEAR